MSKARIQIVEDEVIVSSHLELRLEFLGFQITSVVTTGEEAVEKAKEESPDLVLMDINLDGEMDGVEAAEEIYAQCNIPIIFLTAHSDKEILDRAKKAEPFGYIIKPFEDKELYSVIEIALYKHESERKLSKMAYFDTLTGLPNRNVFFDRLNQQIKSAGRCNKIFAVLFLDLDNFKPVNDNYGHGIGDKLLQEVARRLCGCVRKSDTVARVGGDEFNIILSDLSSIRDVEIVAHKIILNLNDPFYLKENRCSIGVSIGISLYPSDGTDMETLIKNADKSMYSAKMSGGNRYFAHSRQNITIENLIDTSVIFVTQHRGVWDHNQWIEFVYELQKEGFDISERIQFHIGLLLDSLRNIYQEYPEYPDIEKSLLIVTRASVNFVKNNRGIWGHPEWEGHLKLLKESGFEVTEEDQVNIGNILEVTKGLFLILEEK